MMRRTKLCGLVIANVLLMQLYAIKVLLLGDSTDRQIVENWCAHSNGTGFVTHRIGWGPKTLKYGGKSDILSPNYCVDSEGNSIASIHVFGSSPHGPYYSDDWEVDNRTNPFADFEIRDSSYRTTEGVRSYCDLYGTPDCVFLKTVNWDNIAVADGKDPSAASNFLANTAARLADIRSVVGEGVLVGVATVPQVYDGRGLAPQLNAQLRDYAAQRDLLLYDYDMDVWSSVGFHYNVETQLKIMRLKDQIHPVPFYSALAGQKLLQRAYSGYLQLPGRSQSGRHSMQVFSEVPSTISDFVFVRAVVASDAVQGVQAVHAPSPALSFLEKEEPAKSSSIGSGKGGWRRWANVSPHALRHLRLGHNDVLPLLSSALEKLPFAGTVPDGLFSTAPTFAAPSAAGAGADQGQRYAISAAGEFLAVLEGGQLARLNCLEDFRYLGMAKQVSKRAGAAASKNYVCNASLCLLKLQTVAEGIPASWLGLMGVSEAPRVPSWLFTNGTLVRAHTEKQVREHLHSVHSYWSFCRTVSHHSLLRCTFCPTIAYLPYPILSYCLSHRLSHRLTISCLLSAHLSYDFSGVPGVRLPAPRDQQHIPLLQVRVRIRRRQGHRYPRPAGAGDPGRAPGVVNEYQ